MKSSVKFYTTSPTHLSLVLVAVEHELDHDEGAVVANVEREVNHARGGAVELLAQLEAAAEDGGLVHGQPALLACGVVRFPPVLVGGGLLVI